MQSAIFEVTLPALDMLFQLPEGANIAEVSSCVERQSLRIRVDGMGWSVAPGGKIPTMLPPTIIKDKARDGSFVWHCPAPGETPEAYSKRTNHRDAPSGTRELPVFDFTAEMQKAEQADFDETSVFSCAHYYAEYLYGFSSSMPGWTPAAPDKFKQAGIAYHGELAWGYIGTLVGILGMDSFEGYFDGDYGTAIMQAAIVASEYHRGVRG